MTAVSQEHYAQCEELLRARDRDLWLACLFTPPDARKHIHALYAFAQEAADVSGKVTQPLLGEMRLQWWVDALEGAAAPGEGARANPLADALIDTIERFALPRKAFIELAEAHIFDLYDDRMPSWSALKDYCRATSSAPMRWAACILGADLEGPSARALDEAGVALGLTRIARAIAERPGQQKFLPDEAFATDGAPSAGRKELRLALKEMRTLAQSHYDEARRLALNLGAARAALLPAATIPLYLERLARSDYDSRRPPDEPSPLRRQWRIWRASRGVGCNTRRKRPIERGSRNIRSIRYLHLGDFVQKRRDPGFTEMTTLEYEYDARRLRMETLLMLRWVAITGQAAACLGVYFILGFDFPVGLCFVFITASATLNIGMRFGTPRSFRLGDVEAAVLLGYDIIQLGFLLYLTGGLTNSFAMLFLTPVIISSVSLPSNLTLLLGIVMIAVATVLAVEYYPLPWYPNEKLTFPLLYRAGIWAALALSAAFIGIYAARVSDEARLLADALAATELVLEREQHLSQLDGLAAAAAHELGTPLATITLIIKELRKAVPENAPALRDDLALLAQEAARCREILGKLASLGAMDQSSVMNLLSIDTLIQEVVEPQFESGVEVEISKSGPPDAPVLARNPAILYGLGNLVENAMDFANSHVKIDAWWSQSYVTISIQDDGPGFSPDILDRLGDPYLRGRPTERRTKNDPDSGLGLGLFIAKTLLERSGAIVETTNVSPPRTGAVVKVTWPRAALEPVAARPKLAEQDK